MKILEINKADLENNINIIKKIIEDSGKKSEIIAVVKANGMGLDIIKVSEILVKNGIKTLAVSAPEEAIKLRKEGKIENEILMLSPTVIKKELQLLIENDITLTVGNNEELKLIEEIAEELKKEEVKVHLKIDTGFARYGFLYTDIQNILSVFKDIQRVKIVGTYTHFSKPINEKWTNIQFNRFCECIEKIKQANYNPGILHCASSTAFLKYPRNVVKCSKNRLCYSRKNTCICARTKENWNI